MLINFPISSVMIIRYGVLDLLQGAKIWVGGSKTKVKQKISFAELALKIMCVTSDLDTGPFVFFNLQFLYIFYTSLRTLCIGTHFFPAAISSIY